MPRQARLDSPGTLHHVIIRGIEQRAIVDDDTDREKFVSRMGHLAEETKTKIYAWALMTNHAHILLRSGPQGLSGFMRRLLTGYAISYNRRHQRHGYLFQNRYKSIVCQEDTYFHELFRYIHLNPLRAGIVDSISRLDTYPWAGHSAVMGKTSREWQDVDYVLSWFGKSVSRARKAYRTFVEDGVSMGRRPDLVGGGLIRSLGGWSKVLSARKRKGKILSDTRILGESDFIERLLREAEEQIKRQFPVKDREKEAEQVIREICEREGDSVEAICSGSRRKRVAEARARIALILVNDMGMSMAEAARRLGVTTSAISQMVRRKERESGERER